MSKTGSAKGDFKARSSEAKTVSNSKSVDLLTLKRRLQPASPAAKEFLKHVKVGAKVRVNYLITEGNKKRIQVFEGTVIAIRSPNTPDGTFTVRKLSFGVGVERTYPIHSPNIVKVEVVSHGKVRRSKLYYLRDALTQKDSKLRTKYLSQKGGSSKDVNNIGAVQLDDQFEGESNNFDTEQGYSSSQENNQTGADTTARI